MGAPAHLGCGEVADDADLQIVWSQLAHDAVPHLLQRQRLNLLGARVPEPPASTSEGGPHYAGSTSLDGGTDSGPCVA